MRGIKTKPMMNKSFSALARTLLASLLLAAQAFAGPAWAQAAPPAPPSGPVAGAAASPAAAPEAAATATATATATEGYVIGTGDVIEVGVLGREDYKARVQVQVDGSIQLPLIKDVKAADRTVLQLRNDIRTALMGGGYFTDPAVSVVVVGYTSRYVTVLGEVTTPGLVPIDRSYRLSEIIARAGGLKPSAAEDLVLTRSSGESQTYSMKTVATGGEDPVVNPNDRIFVDKIAEFYVTGAVNGPGVHPLRPGMTLRMAIARAGGTNAQGSMKRVKVFRDGKQVPGFGLEQVIQPGDSIEVGERLF